MRIKKFLLSAMLLLLALSTNAAVKTEGNCVTVDVERPTANGARVVCLEVINDNIIRVRATSESALPKKQESLMIVKQTAKPQFSTSEHGDIVEVKAKNVTAQVDKKTGQITFFDADGKRLAKETKDGKTFAPFRVPDREIGIGTITDEQRNGLSWTLKFENQPEAFYGLGQHQAEELNMRGKNEDLFQYNTKVSIPFVLSNAGYGILWDSYSYCRFGNPHDYMQLNRVFKLYDKRGREGHLTGTYVDKDGNRIVRDEDSLYYEYAMPEASEVCNRTDKGGIQNLPKGFKLNGANVVYEGFIEANTTELYQFILYYAGYMKVYIGGEEVVPERWRTAWNPNSWKFTKQLRQGQKTQIRVEWQPDGDVSYCGLRVSEPRTRDEREQLCIWSEMSRDMDYYFIAGEKFDDIISGYRTLTGKAPVYPKWVLGFWQSRERYKSQAEIEETLAEFRKRHIPVDNIVQDWNYWKLDSWGDHTFEASRYPNPQQMLDNVHQMHGRFMISVWPKFYDTVGNYKELDAKGWIYHQAITDDIHDWLGYRGSFYDAYDAGARKMFWRQMDENLYTKYNHGVDAWWMDASEPNVRDCTPMWYRKALSGPTALGSSTEYFNAYSTVNADAIYNGQRSVFNGKANEPRVFLLTRSGFAGEQRYSTATWSGDIGTRWEDMRAQMTAGLNYSMSGIPFWGMDQGGFCVENRYVAAQQEFDKTGNENADLTEWRELQARWNQFGCFIPLYRAHGQWPLREVWNIAPENHPTYKTIVWYDKFRYRMMPYLYSMAGWAHLIDYTLMRALVMDFNGDRQVYDIKDQWMFGPAFMACPVGTYKARNRSVYFPKQCGWYDLYTGEYIQGGQSLIVDAPFERIPVFVREGSVIPYGPEMEWCDEKPADNIILYVYAGADGKFQIYEDEGTNYNYEKGKYATIDITYNDASRTLTIGKTVGSYNGMPKARNFTIVYCTKDKAQELTFEPANGKTVKYNGKEVSVKL
ncbi:MAG: glycoside hydrolase family 31 protein [Prevotella sp.]|nr:glycoside hydrolase family 31 protein [Prevotella sp.]